MPRRTAGASRTSATSPSSTGAAPRVDDDRLPEVVDARGAADGAHRPLGRAARHEAAGGVLVRALERVHDLVERDAARRHAVRVELHLELAQVAAEDVSTAATPGTASSRLRTSNSARSRSAIRSSAPGSASSVNSKISLSRPVRLESSGASVPGGSCGATCATRSATSWRER